MQAKTVFTQRLNWMSVGTSCGNPLRMTSGAVRVHVMVTLANNLIGECNMTDQDIRDFIESCEEPLFMKDVLSELRSTDPTISQKRVARLLREVGFENRPCKNVRNPKGKGSAWFRTGNAVTIDDDEVDETEEKPEPKSTEQIIDEVEERNEHTTSLNAKLLETLNVSRGLKAEMIARQQEVLVDMARRILGLYGSEKERKAYGVL
jgi:hypothetical protein